MNKVITFGEIMLRLKSPGFERLLQSASLEATFGGAEANVAVSLANFGMDAAFCTLLPDNEIGTACARELRAFGVDTGLIRFVPGRLGVYYVESGACQRSGKVIYDRAYSTMALAKPGDIDWTTAFRGAGWFHLSGITPAVSESAAMLTLEAAKTARAMGLTVSCDLNYRGKLWQWGRKPPEIMRELVRYADVLIGSEDEFEICLSLASEDSLTGEAHIAARAKQVKDAFPNLTHVALALNDTQSSDHTEWGGCLYDGKECLFSKRYSIRDIVDRVGAGDAYAAGIIYGLNAFGDPGRAVEFAAAAAAFKFTIPGDYNRVTAQEVATVAGGAAGGVQR